MKPAPLMDLFLRHVNKTEKCWLWTGVKNKGGYGLATKGNRKSGMCKAHRRAWELFRGPVPNGLWVLHKCDNPPCVNPDHLFLGTPLDNVLDARRKGRLKLPREYQPEAQVRGELHPAAKLKAAWIPEIFALSRSGVKNRQIAGRFGVTRHAIEQVLSRQSWSHIPID